MSVRLDVTEFCPSSPAVILSPNARNDVVDNLDGLVTVTVNEQLSVRCNASVAAQVTVFCPIENGDPGTGVQVVLTGACPFDTIGALLPPHDGVVIALRLVRLDGTVHRHAGDARDLTPGGPGSGQPI
jgi:hypothetical protein